jgi:hypothetical protein
MLHQKDLMLLLLVLQKETVLWLMNQTSLSME